jgi:eukaryotic-like serine/threonine-protein kinase
MAQQAADRNLLFGILAMQMDFITREQLIAAMQAWVFDKAKTLGEILQAQKAMAEDNRALLEALVRKHLARHDNDTEKSLAAISPAGNVRNELERIADADVQASLIHVGGSPQDADPYATAIGPLPGKTPASGMRFRIVRPHAKGGLGEVFVARDEELNREVALKEIQDQRADHPESRARFLLEAEITGGLEHPGIVPVYGLGAYPDGRPYYAMRFIRGDSLKEAIDRYHEKYASLDAGQRTLILRALLGRLIDVCNAIAYAHARGVLHRDLKPGNIMLGKYGETLVVDWGLAKPLGESASKEPTEPGEGSLIPSSRSSASATIAGAAVGTPQYMSPEQAAGRLDLLGPASDVYSLGATLYCILTGKSPLGESDIGTILQRVQRGDIPRPRELKADVDPALDAICMKAMALIPQNRYSSPKQLADDMEQWLADEPVTALPEPWTRRTRRWIGRHATLVTGAASAALVALVGFIIATVLLTAANERERKARADERIAKEKAEQNYQLARAAVDKYHTSVSESRLLHEPGMQPLREELLKSAREFYAKFVKEREGDPTVNAELGRATYRLAQITGDIGDKAEAIALHEKAAGIFEALPSEKLSAEYQSDLAACYHHLGRLSWRTDGAKAERAYSKALTFWERLVTEQPSELAFQAGLARTLNGLGNHYQNQRKLDRAEDHYQKAIERWEALLKARPRVPEYQRDLATALNNRAAVFKDTGKDAEPEYRAAAKVQQQLVDQFGHISQYQDDLARTLFNLGYLRTAAGPGVNDAADLEEAAKIWKALAERHPAHNFYQLHLAGTYAELARAYREAPAGTANAKRGEEVCELAIKIQRNFVALYREDRTFQYNLVRGLLAMGDMCSAHKENQRAESAYLEALKLQSDSGKSADDPHVRAQLAHIHHGLGLLYIHTHEAKAGENFNKEIMIWEKLIAELGNVEEYACGLANARTSLGNLMSLTKKEKEALPCYLAALACLDRKRVNIESAAVRNALFQAYWGRAAALTSLKQYPDALADWDRTIELARKNQQHEFKLLRAEALVRSGNYRTAVQDADRLTPAGSGNVFLRFARIYSLAAGSVGADEKLPPSERKKLADQYAARAIEILVAAHAKNHFKSPSSMGNLQEDPELQALRERPEFKKLISAVQAP